MMDGLLTLFCSFCKIIAAYLPSRFQILIMDLITAFLQAFMIILAYEVGHYGKEANLDDSIDVATRNGEAAVEEDDTETDSDADSEGDALLDNNTRKLRLSLSLTIHSCLSELPSFQPPSFLLHQQKTGLY
jgi:hypothetical protein